MKRKVYTNGERMRDVVDVLGGYVSPIYIDYYLVRRKRIRYICSCFEIGMNLYECESDFTVDGFEFKVGDMIACA